MNKAMGVGVTLGEKLARFDAAQRSLKFKVIASIALAALLLVGVGALVIIAKDPEIGRRVVERASQDASVYEDPSFFETGPLGTVVRAAKTSVQVAAGQEGFVTIAGTMAAVVVGVGLIVWLGLSLTALATATLGWGLAWFFSLLDATAGLGNFLTAAVPLLITFWVGMRAVGAALSGPWPWAAVARNVLSEAVRMKVSAVFIVLLIIVLAFTPSLLSEAQPLRYRIQQWLQYGIGLSYVVLALLTLFLSVASVSYEQRDRVIWQTMTKPIPRWQYITGKWCGVMLLNAVLLTVSAFGVYLFTEYLRYQPANGEAAYLVPETQAGEDAIFGEMVNDRRILEQQVLVARVTRSPEPYEPSEATLDRMVKQRVDEQLASDPSFENTNAVRRSIREELEQDWQDDLERAIEQRIERLRSSGVRVPETRDARIITRNQIIEEWEQAYRTLPVGVRQVFNFRGLEDVYEEWARFSEAISTYEEQIVEDIERRVDEMMSDPSNVLSEEEARFFQTRVVRAEWDRSGRLPEPPHLMLRFRVNSGSNDPSLVYRITFYFAGSPPIERQVSLKAPQVLDVPLTALTDDGWLSVVIQNAGARGNINVNQRAISFETDGLELMYAVGGYEVNFVRILGVIFIKLGFIAAVGISVATFLSFPIACLVGIAILFMAESSVFLAESLEYFDVKKFGKDDVSFLKVAAREISQPIAWMFRAYGELKPTSKLVDGLLVSWTTLFRAIGIVGVWTLFVLGIGLAIFRNRELGTYSGH